MKFDVLTLFPEIFHSFLEESLIQKALAKELMEIKLYNFRQHGLGKHLKVDEEPYGGGPGMLLRIEPIAAALKVRGDFWASQGKKTHKIMLTPQGRVFNQAKAKELAARDEVILLLCGRYEGFDERIRDLVDEEISAGDFVCLGGEVIAMMIIETVSRLLPGVLGNNISAAEESFAQGILEYPQYTRPVEFEQRRVPEVLMSGNHQQIAKWRLAQAQLRTQQRRPDLL